MGSKHNKQHHILPVKVAIAIGIGLLVLTAVTVVVAQIDLGRLNFTIAMIVATIKALFVVLYFMGLKFDRRENGVIFATAFIFLAIFMVLVSTDLFFRDDHVYVKGPLVMPSAPGVSKYKKPWISTPELVAHGKELFAIQCGSCHGSNGEGNGPAATALNPSPRNFHHTEGWKNGRKATMVFKTLKEGLPPSGMASYSTLPEDDRWALAHYVLSLGPQAEADTAEDYKKVAVDPTKDSMGSKVDPSIPVAYALELMALPDPESQGFHANMKSEKPCSHPGGKIYEARCVQCHGIYGKGGLRVKTLGSAPTGAYVVTQPFAQSQAMQSFERFQKAVVDGMSGEIMPGNADLSRSDLQDLYEYTKGLNGIR